MAEQLSQQQVAVMERGMVLKEGDLEDEHEKSRDASSQWYSHNPGDDDVPVGE